MITEHDQKVMLLATLIIAIDRNQGVPFWNSLRGVPDTEVFKIQKNMGVEVLRIAGELWP